MEKKFLIMGKRIYLRKIISSDANKKYVSWMNDRRVNRFLESRFKKWSIRDLKSYIKMIDKSGDNLFLAIILKNGDKHIGNIKIGLINRIHRNAEIGIIIGEQDCWGNGYATEAIKLVAGYCFDSLKLHRLTAGAYKNNLGSIKAFGKAGFSIEGLKKKHFKFNGSYVDGVALGIVKK